MAEDVRFLVKLGLTSAGLAALIKYGGPLVPLPSTSPVALTIVLSPVAGVGLWLAWLYQRQGN